MHSYEMPSTAEFLAVERERKMALGQAFVRVILRPPMTTIPNHHCPAAIFALRDRPFELVVGDRVILDLHSKALFAWHQTGSARHRPTFHHTVEFEA